MSSDNLLTLLVDIGLAQAEALDMFDTPRYSRLHFRANTIVNILRARPGDERRLLYSHFEHKSYQVRLNAAHALLPSDPTNVEPVLRQIAESGWQPQAGDAGMSLRLKEMGLTSKEYLSDAWLAEKKPALPDL